MIFRQQFRGITVFEFLLVQHMSCPNSNRLFLIRKKYAYKIIHMKLYKIIIIQQYKIPLDIKYTIIIIIFPYLDRTGKETHFQGQKNINYPTLHIFWVTPADILIFKKKSILTEYYTQKQPRRQCASDCWLGDHLISFIVC